MSTSSKPITQERQQFLTTVHEPLLITLLVLLAAALFVLTYWYVHAFQVRREVLAKRWFGRGERAMLARQPEAAVNDLRTALSYAPDEFNYRLRLAQALAAAGHNNQAYAYFRNLWDAEPGDGLLNLELARLAVRRRDTNDALRWFHGAIYGLWNDDPELHRRQARLELIDFLVAQNMAPQAQSELMALAPTLPADAALHERVGALFYQVHDDARALEQYQTAGRLQPASTVALAGAGETAFRMGDYRQAVQYLQRLLREDPNNAQASQLVDTAEAVLNLNPYAPRLPALAARERTRLSFQQAGKRLTECAQAKAVNLSASPASDPLQSQYAQWKGMAPKITERNLRRDPDLIDAAMDLAFAIEQQADAECGTAGGADAALLLIAKSRAGVQR